MTGITGTAGISGVGGARVILGQGYPQSGLDWRVSTNERRLEVQPGGTIITRAQTFHHLLPYALPRGYSNTAIQAPRPGMEARRRAMEGPWGGDWECRVQST